MDEEFETIMGFQQLTNPYRDCNTVANVIYSLLHANMQVMRQRWAWAHSKLLCFIYKYVCTNETGTPIEQLSIPLKQWATVQLDLNLMVAYVQLTSDPHVYSKGRG